MTAAQPAVDADEALLAAWVRGEQAAFARLYDRHDRACFDFIRRLLGPEATAIAEELHQETWVAVSRAAAGFDADKARFGTWLFTIARNKVMDHFRQHAKLVTIAGSEGEALAQSLPDEAAATPERLAHDRELGAALLREVEALPLAQREAFVLFAWDELSLEEVASVTQVGVETAKSRLRYARTTLRTRLAAWWGREDER